jgi:hypothetical protein
MTKERIEELANYFYDRESPRCRLSVIQGMSGFDLSRQAFVRLLTVLSNSYELDSELEYFIQTYSSDYE